MGQSDAPINSFEALVSNAISKPLVEHIFTADPAAHVWNGRIYIYPSHDIDAGIPENDYGDHFDMRDYHVLSIRSGISSIMTARCRAVKRTCVLSR